MDLIWVLCRASRFNGATTEVTIQTLKEWAGAVEEVVQCAAEEVDLVRAAGAEGGEAAATPPKTDSILVCGLKPSFNFCCSSK